MRRERSGVGGRGGEEGTGGVGERRAEPKGGMVEVKVSGAGGRGAEEDGRTSGRRE